MFPGMAFVCSVFADITLRIHGLLLAPPGNIIHVTLREMNIVPDYQTITRKYYASWLGGSDQDFNGGVRYICSPERDVQQSGYPFAYPLCICKTDRAVIVSYAAAFQQQVAWMKETFLRVQDFDPFPLERFESLFAGKIRRQVCFVFDRQITVPVMDVITLSMDDYQIFLDFTLARGIPEWDGMREYFEKIVAAGYCFAKIVEGKAVSLSDGADMPYMADMVQEVGISTLPGYRRRGYAREVASVYISKILADLKCPQWTADIINFAYHKLAFSLGFKYFGDLYILPAA
jgi:hypothetical protein